MAANDHSRKFQDLTGRKYGRWTVVRVASRGGSKVKWECLCECGATGVIVAGSLRNGLSTSCGCRRREVCSANIYERFPEPTAAELARRRVSMNATKRAWRKKNPEAARGIRERAYAKADPLYYAVAARKRKAMLLSAPGDGLTYDQCVEIFEQFASKCAYCLGEATSIDHVVPITRCGAHDPSNIVPACKSCNSSKGNRSLLRFVMNGGGVV